MRMRWFGDPWPTADLRAPICADDRYRVEAPLGHPCLGCGHPIIARERGVLMAASMEIDGAFTVEIPTDEFEEGGLVSRDKVRHAVVAEHIDCLVRDTLGPDFEPLPVERVPR